MRLRPPAAGLFLALALWLRPWGAPAESAPQAYWKVRMTVEASGSYRMEGANARSDGTYAFRFEWEGGIERDGEDYLLIHHRSDLVTWRIEERNTSATGFRILTTNDVPDKPVLRVNYFLREKGFLRVNFVVEGFDVPCGTAGENFSLVLPASAENASRAGGVHYNMFIKKGTNDVSLDDKRLSGGPAEASFAWTWAYQTRILKADETVLLASGHEAKVSLTITPVPH